MLGKILVKTDWITAVKTCLAKVVFRMLNTG
jgi:hypothetical protein